MKNAKKKSIAEKIAKEVHISVKEIIKNFSSYKFIIKNDEIIKSLQLDEEETGYLKNYWPEF